MNVKLISKIIMGFIVFLDIYSKIPQIRTLLKYKVSAGISVKSYILWNTSSALYILYCVLINEVPLLIETTLNLILNSVIALLAWKYKAPLVNESSMEIFERLGYIKHDVSEAKRKKHIIEIYKKKTDDNKSVSITFFSGKYFRAELKYNNQVEVYDLSAEETAVVNKRMKELGWI